MNSPSQHSYNQKLIKDRHFSKNVDLQLLDYRNIKGTYDKIVSIEMVEAVGEKYWPTYFNKIKESLKPLGTAMIQSITIKEDRFDEYRSSTDFIKKYVFPGGMLLTNNNIAKQANKADLKSGTPFDFGLGYAETLKRWRVAFNHSLATGALNFPDEKFIKLWNFYLSYCEGAFLAGRINVTQIELEN